MNESARQSVHMGSVVFALLLRWLTPWQSILFGCGAVAFNLWILPHVGRALFRSHERAGRVSGGIAIYPIVVLLLIALPGAAMGRMDIAAGAWAIMAIGDGAATLVGRAVRGPRIPWNRAKTIVGSAALALGGAAAAAFFLHWIGGWASWTPDPVPLAVAALCAGVCAALIESLPLPVDDNWTVPVTSALVLLAAASASPRVFAAGVAPHDVLVGVVIASGFGTAAYMTRAVSLGGLCGGVVLGTAMWAVSGGWAFAALAVFFALASLTTRAGGRTKERTGTSEPRGGRRGAEHAWANGGVGLALAALSAASSGSIHVVCAVGSVAAIATAAADTVATEVGQWIGGATVSARTGRRVSPGTPGGVGLAGTVAGLFAAACVACVCWGLHAIPAIAVPVVVGAAGVGSLVESVWNARLRAADRTPLVHHALNVGNTLVGGLVAVTVMWTVARGK